MLATWLDEPHRATRDVDLPGFGDAAEDALLGSFREIMAAEGDDGVSFDLGRRGADWALSCGQPTQCKFWLDASSWWIWKRNTGPEGQCFAYTLAE